MTEIHKYWHALLRMALKPQNATKRQRPARIRVPNRERVLFTIHDRKFVGVVQRLSLTGGSVIHTEAPLPKGTLAGLDLRTVFGKVTAQIEFLHTGADGIAAAQAFRFLGMDDFCTRRLKAAIEQMRSAGFSDEEPGQKGLAELVSSGLSTFREHIQRLSSTRALRGKGRARR